MAHRDQNLVKAAIDRLNVSVDDEDSENDFDPDQEYEDESMEE